MEPYPPEYDEEAPEHGLMEFQIAIGVCWDCEEIIGPDHAQDVGYILWREHEDHDGDIIAEWEEVEVHEPHDLFESYKAGEFDA